MKSCQIKASTIHQYFFTVSYLDLTKQFSYLKFRDVEAPRERPLRRFVYRTVKKPRTTKHAVTVSDFRRTTPRQRLFNGVVASGLQDLSGQPLCKACADATPTRVNSVDYPADWLQQTSLVVEGEPVGPSVCATQLLSRSENFNRATIWVSLI